MSIHKSQGQTIQRVKVDLEKVFEKGALSGPPSPALANITSCRPKLCRSLPRSVHGRPAGPTL
ncbi:uncharacterized protein PHACADRAFT_254756 [Phanerochaete carnosa HHB-10118-sp]|uniref:Uncharacterized protein n=1 Tax=Phanerochaete carnosa (strain HHB-10118-sp) TaxID=650164 RepID=K5X2Y7_PHACS|nr:uncharacterized protein PHACADRAFT_254756 [Phanerochaete carnosa HHB-10118-sp]EKM57172.1 hypothetical protein PHACADRAFT_254756 [Phanerochaete carnosa HHB-10118-sp]